MNLRLVYISILGRIQVLGNNYSNFLTDYFVYKKVPSLVGYSCNNELDDLELQKRLNTLHIFTVLGHVTDLMTFRRTFLSNYRKLGIFVDLRCFDSINATNLFNEATKFRLFDELHVWLILGSNLEETIDAINDEAFGLSTDVVISISSDDEKIYELYDVYNPEKTLGGKLKITHFGTWRQNELLVFQSLKNKQCRRFNLEGMILKASFLSKFKPKHMNFTDYLTESSDPLKDALSKFGYKILYHLSELFNFSLTAIESDVWKEGDAIGPVIRSLSKNEVEFSGSPATMSVPRLSLVKYTFPARPFRTCFIFRSPPESKFDMTLLFKPMQDDCWLCLGFMILLFLGCFLIALSFEFSTGAIGQISDTVLLIICSVCQQGTDFKMARNATRSLYLNLVLMCFIIYTYYSASIVSTRLNDSITKINDSLNELSKLNMKMSSEPMLYFYLFMKRKDWEVQQFYNKSWLPIPENERFLPPELGAAEMKKGFYAYHAHPDVIYPFIQKLFDNREICELNEVNLARPTFSTFAVTFNSSFIEMSRFGFIKVSEIGLRIREVLRFASSKPICRPDILSAKSINILESAYVLTILFTGFSISIVVFLIEKLLYYYKAVFVEQRN